MNYISDRDYNAQMKAIKRMNQSKEREMKLRKEREKYGFKLKMPSTSKIVLFVSLVICLQIVFFCERLMVELKDTSALYVLLGIPATMAPIIWAYFSKSKAENTKNGIVYETAMRNQAASEDEPCDNAPNDPSF
jgi:hypothetical protein|nr:MAG TPA: hypothetical protein [Caudoviricetes sp.]